MWIIYSGIFSLSMKMPTKGDLIEYTNIPNIDYISVG